MKKLKKRNKVKKTETQKREELIKLIEELREMNMKKEKPLTWQEMYKYARTFD